MFFQLLFGVHREATEVFEVELIRGDNNEIVDKKMPIVESESDLVKNFGRDKFRKLSESEVSVLRAGVNVSEEPALTGTASDTPVAIAPPVLGRDVTIQFPGARLANCLVYLKPGGKYTVVDKGTNQVVNEGYLKKDEIPAFLKGYIE